VELWLRARFVELRAAAALRFFSGPPPLILQMSSLEVFADAIENGDSSVVESLISSGVDVNARLPRPGEPPALASAAACGKADLVDILLQANARIDDTDENGWTACHYAAYSGNDDCWLANRILPPLIMMERPLLKLRWRIVAMAARVVR